MFQNLPSYADLSVAGDWLPEVPTHWSWDPARTLFKERKETGYVDEPLLSVTIARGVIPQAELLASTSKKDSSNADKSKYKLVETGDLVYNKMRAWQGAAGLSRHRGIVSPAYIVMTPRRGEAAFFHHLVRTPMFAKEAERWSYGITSDQWSLRPEHFKMIRFPVPPAEEQAAIVKYLAHANARIDKAIAAKRRLIALLDEQSRAVANDFVTRAGGRGPLRATGIPWLPEVPEDWDVAPLKRYWTVTDCKHLTVPFVDEGIPLASVSQAQRFYLDLSDAKRTDHASYENLIGGGRKPRRGDLIYCRNVGVGAAAVVDTDEVFAMGQDVCLLRSLGQGDPVFLNHFLKSDAMRAQLELILVGSTFRRINVEDVRALTIVVPPFDVQRDVAAAIARATAPTTAVAAKEMREIELLREFRSRLVADVVTGQVDVRRIAEVLPGIDPSAVWGDANIAGGVDEAETDDVLAGSDA
jgi:type I restriction enzyme S subunit